MILNPGEYFTVVRELADPNDTGTYYVQAKIRNARTGVLLATLNLTDEGGQRFTKEYQVPQDTSGLGFYISASTRVYTDGAHSALSDMYGQESETYLVDNRFRQMGGGGGADIDYKKIKKLFLEALGEFDFKFPLFDLSPVLEKLGTLLSLREVLLSASNKILNVANRTERKVEIAKRAVDSIKFPDIPEQKEPDLAPVLAAIKAIPAPEKVDLSPVTSAAEEIRAALDPKALSGLQDAAQALEKVLSSPEFKASTGALPELANSAQKIESQIKDFLYVLSTSGVKTQKETPPTVPAKDHMKTALDITRRFPLPKPVQMHS